MKEIELKRSIIFKCPYKEFNSQYKYCLGCTNYKGISNTGRNKILCDKDEYYYKNTLYSKMLLIETKVKKFIVLN